jgi:hypothetical protein
MAGIQLTLEEMVDKERDKPVGRRSFRSRLQTGANQWEYAHSDYGCRNGHSHGKTLI